MSNPVLLSMFLALLALAGCGAPPEPPAEDLFAPLETKVETQFYTSIKKKGKKASLSKSASL